MVLFLEFPNSNPLPLIYKKEITLNGIADFVCAKSYLNMGDSSIKFTCSSQAASGLHVHPSAS